MPDADDPRPSADAPAEGGGSGARPRVVVADPLDADARAWLAERCDVVGATDPHAGSLRRDDLLALLPDADGLIVRTATGVDRAVLDAGGRLRVIGRAGVGVDHIDLGACAERGLPVVHTPDANTAAVVEYVLALVCDACRPRVFLDTPLDAPRWERARRDLTAPREINELTVGVYGCGRIGARAARVFCALGCRVLCHDLRRLDPGALGGAEAADRETLLGHSDVVTLHVDGRPANRGLIGESAFALLRSDVVLINTARGRVIDHGLLAEFLGVNPGAQALLDVHEVEPVPHDSLLWGVPNAHLAPHLASCTASAKSRMSWVVRDVWRVLCGQPPEHPATPG